MPAAALLEAAAAAHASCAPTAAPTAASPSLARVQLQRQSAAAPPAAATFVLHALQGVSIQSPLVLGRAPQQVCCVCVDVWVCVCAFVCECVFVYVCLCMCVYVCVCVFVWKWQPRVLGFCGKGRVWQRVLPSMPGSELSNRSNRARAWKRLAF